MVFKLEETSKGSKQYKQSEECQFIIHKMQSKGLDVFCYLSVQGDELIALITAPGEKLRAFADAINFQMELDPHKVKHYLEQGLKDESGDKYVIKPIYINEDRKFTPYSPFDHIFGKFGQNIPADLYLAYEKNDPRGGLFNKYYRMKLIYYILKGPESKGGCDLEVNLLVFRKKISAFYPLHDRRDTADLMDRNANMLEFPWNDSLTQDLRDYFGEKIALYFVFMGHYSVWLIIPGIIGLVFQIIVFATGNYSSPILPFYSLVITVWAIVMLEYWKRKEQMKAMDWGMTSFEESEPDRPEYKGTMIRSYIDGEETLYFSPDEFTQRFAASQGVILTFVLVVIGCVASIYVLRYSLQADVGANASTIASILNTIQITLLNMAYQFVATALTDSENHRTDTEYEDNLITKLFMFQFLNSYASFFFLAFIATWLPKPNGVPAEFVGQCGAENCMEPLAINLAIIFGTRLFVKNGTDILVPYIQSKMKLKEETKGFEDKALTLPEQDYVLMQYNVLIDSINNYADAAIQFGYSSLFVTALPMAPFFSFLCNLARNKLNIVKLTTMFQRPIPAGAQDIGSWMGIFQLMSVLSVITNGAIICFTMTVLNGQATSAGRVWLFIGFIIVLIVIQFIVQAIIPDEPEEVEIQKKRIQFISSKLIDRQPDEEMTPLAGFNGVQDPDLGAGSHPTGFFVRMAEMLCGSSEEGGSDAQLREFNVKMKREGKVHSVEVREYGSNVSASNLTMNPMNKN
jgi:anoctamin-10/anoctamin-7